jgi:hypothetical protein
MALQYHRQDCFARLPTTKYQALMPDPFDCGNSAKPVRQNAEQIHALAGFKRLISVIKYQELMPDPFDRFAQVA